jgi:hypothetical protein
MAKMPGALRDNILLTLRHLRTGWRLWVVTGVIVLGNLALYALVGRPEMALERDEPAVYRAIFTRQPFGSAATRCVLLCTVYTVVCVAAPILGGLATFARDMWVARRKDPHHT